MNKYTCNSPVFSSSIRVVEVTDLAYAPNVNESVTQLLQNDLVIAAVFDPALVERAFKRVFPYIDPEEDPDAMTEEEIEEAIDHEWTGGTSDDPDAMSSTEVTQALKTTWSGEASTDPNAMTPMQIDAAIANGSKL